jgi:hypothetical protein
MTFKSEAHSAKSENLAVDLGLWESQKAAQIACSVHADRFMPWVEIAPRLWEAQNGKVWYNVIQVA